MALTRLSEIHDNRLFPAFLRDLVTDALQALWKFSNAYSSIAADLNSALIATSTRQILDLCSGAGGPWLHLSRQLEQHHNTSVHVQLTDKYPNSVAFDQNCRNSAFKITRLSDPIDALHVPDALAGFRTIFSSFHHFRPSEACGILLSAVEQGRGIGVFEIPRRSVRTLVALCFTPILVLLLTPLIRPFRWSRLFWTYVLPVVPVVIGIDGLISCLRAYTLDELRQMVREIEIQVPDRRYAWHLGEARGALLPVTYLIGYPRA